MDESLYMKKGECIKAEKQSNSDNWFSELEEQ
jgi:hypothetical protein